MDSVLKVYYWSGLIDNVAIILFFVFVFLFLAWLFTTIVPIIDVCIDFEEKKAFRKTSDSIAFFLVLVASILILLPSPETRQTFIAAKITAMQNDDSLLPAEREALQKLAATLPQNTEQKGGGCQ